jgi:uncharacterized membrane protein YraQ (UPF0718 family)
MQIKKKLSSIIVHSVIFSFLVIPLVSFGQTTPSSSAPACDALFGGSINTFKDIIDYATCLVIKSIVPLLYIIALAVFIYGVIQFFLNPDNAKKREEARSYIIGALIGMFVLFSISGLIEIIRNTFGISGGGIPLLPETQ